MIQKLFQFHNVDWQQKERKKCNANQSSEANENYSFQMDFDLNRIGFCE